MDICLKNILPCINTIHGFLFIFVNFPQKPANFPCLVKNYANSVIILFKNRMFMVSSYDKFRFPRAYFFIGEEDIEAYLEHYRLTKKLPLLR